MTVVNMQEAKTHFAALLQRALAGEDIVVAKHGYPLVRLVPVNALELEPRRFGRHRQTLSAEAIARALAPLSDDDLGDWEAS